MVSFNAFFEFLVKANLALFILGAVYWFLLRKETFHQLNRWVMLGIFCGALTLPFVPVPDYGLGWRAPVLAEAPIENPAVLAPVAETDPIPEVAMADLETPEPAIYLIPAAPTPDMEWLALLQVVYWLVAGMLAIRFVWRILSVVRLIWESDRQNSSVYWNTRVGSPFSFFHCIVLNPGQYAGRIREQIIAHESVHARQGHTLDILAAELVSVLCWFNPMAWNLKNAIRLNLEFIADEEVLQSGLDKKEYQYHLLKSIVPDYQFILANHFNHSFLKNRIAMMNSKKSPAQSKWKYLLILPVLLGLLLAFGPANAQSGVPEKAVEVPAPTPQPAPAVESDGPVVIGAAAPAAVGQVSVAQTGKPAAATAVVGRSGIGRNSASSPGHGVAQAGVAVAPSVNSAGGVSVSGVSAAASGSAPKAGGGSVNSGRSAGVSIPFATNLQSENIYVVIRKETDQKNLETIREELKRRGITFQYSDLLYDKDGRLTRIKLELKYGSKFNGKLDGYNGGRPLTEPLVFYLINNKENFGARNGIPEELGSDVKIKMEKLSGIWIDRGGEDYLSGTYNSDGASIRSGTKENFFVVITANTTREDIAKVEQELDKKGLFLRFKTLEYDAVGRITRVKVEVSDDHGLSGNLSNTYATPEDKIYLFRFYDGDGGFGIGAGSELKNEDELPEKVVKAIRETRSGYKVGTF